MKDETKSEYGKDSESNSDEMKSAESKKNEEGEGGASGKTIKFEKLFAQLDKEGVKDDNEENDSGNNALFWTYNDQEEEDKTVGDKPPQMLIRCVNEFSDLDESEKK